MKIIIKDDNMQFNVNEWRRYYDQIHNLGKMLNDSYPSMDEHRNYVAPTVNLRKDAQLNLEKEIKEWIDRCSKYLDSCGLRPEKPLWKFNIKDPTTHISSPDFAYKHLLRPNDKPIYTNRCYA